MKKKLIQRMAVGLPLGVFIGYTIGIIMSVIYGNGYYSAAVPQFIEQTGSEISAVVLQYVLSAVLGAACAGGSIVWDMQDWSLLKQTIVHFIVMAGSLFPIAWFAWWMPHNIVGILLFFMIFIILYAIMFVIMYLLWKSKIKKMNDCIQNENRT